MANTELVLRMYDYFSKGNMAAIKAEIFHPEIVWRMPGHHPLAGTMTGADQVIAFFGALFRAGITVDNVHFGELDNGTVVEKHIGHGELNGETIDLPTCTTYGIKDGKIADVQVHTAVQHTVDRYMWARIPLRSVAERVL
ncbi:nuclear transport factor 2 family protein [Sorangium sp. So ce291]|uniref:nuclear transport factor 2 family protein n=1 Tax=Sorangium sp. So ce291 TaxID=3133294 RepID=UPI003F63A55E